MENDMSSPSILNRLKGTFRPIKTEPTKTVEFLLLNSLPDMNPTSVKQEICTSSGLKEILWNFSRLKDAKKRLTLKQNPHFYAPLPRSPEAYGDKFKTDPIETFHIEDIRVSVLTDNLCTGRVYLETAHWPKTRVFGNVWMPNAAIIFKDVCGKLEGESIVGEIFRGMTNLWYFEEPPQSPTTGVPIQDWREPILRMLRVRKSGGNVDFNIRITDRPPRHSTPNYLAPSGPSPVIQPHFSSSNDGLAIVSPPHSRQPPLQTEIPEPPTEPIPRIPVPPPPRAPSILPGQLMPTTGPPPPCPAAYPMPLPQQPPTILLPLIGRTTTSLMPHPPNLSWELKFQRSAFPLAKAASDPSRAPIADSEVLPETTTISWEDIRDLRPVPDSVSVTESCSTFISNCSDNLQPDSDSVSVTESTSTFISDCSDNLEPGLPSWLSTSISEHIHVYGPN